MGELIHIHDFIGTLDTPPRRNCWWYFEEENLYKFGLHGTSGSRDAWASMVTEAYPEYAAIHITKLAMSRVAIRRFVRDQLGDVICRDLDLSYEYLDRREREQEGRVIRRSVSHAYVLYHFENNADAVAFCLRFADIVEPVSTRHPSYTTISEESIEDAKNNPWLGQRY